MTHHVDTKKTYAAIFAALMVLTAITVAVARVHLGSLNIVVALAVAATKATLVVLFFMNVRHSPSLTKLTVAAGFVWLAIMLALTLTDYFTRNWLPSPAGW
jgi:cytochrome c oxidase subunit 4